jgi:hypothetical protein
MANYNPSTIARIGDIGLGICVETGIMLNTTYMAQSQQEDFNVYGRIMLLNLFLEVTTDFGAEATLFQYTYSNATHTPAIVSTKLGLVSLTIASATIGSRVYWKGGAVGGTTHVITNLTGGISDLPSVQPMIVGYKNAVGTIGHLTTTASQTAGAGFHSLFYYPMSEGAYVTAIR